MKIGGVQTANSHDVLAERSKVVGKEFRIITDIS